MEGMDASSEPAAVAGIQKLRGRENYSVWKFQMKNLLIQDDLWYPIAGYPEGDTTDEATKVRNDLKALSKINLMLGISCIPHTMRAQTAVEAWRSLENIYEDQGRVNLMLKLLSVKMEDHQESVEDYINKVTMISEQIAETGNPVDEEMLGTILLKGYSDEDCLKPLVISLESSGAKLTSDIAKHWLMMSYYDKMEQLNESNQSDDIGEERTFVKWFHKTSTYMDTVVTQNLLRRKPVANAPHQNGNRKPVICFKCRQPGHKQNQCTGATAGPSNGAEATSVPKSIGKFLIETVAETAIVRGASVMGGAVGGAVATVVSAGTKIIRKK